MNQIEQQPKNIHGKAILERHSN